MYQLDHIQKVGDFQAKFGLSGVEAATPSLLEEKLQEFRLKAQLEELIEYAEAVGFYLDVDSKSGKVQFMKDPDGKPNLEKALDALIDGQYFACGTIRFHGFAQERFDTERNQVMRVYDSGFLRVHNANMRKQRAAVDTQSKRGSTFDVIKPDGWKAAELGDLVK